MPVVVRTVSAFRVLRFLLVLPLIAACGLVRAHPVDFGGHTLEIPSPSGLNEVSQESPDIEQLANNPAYGTVHLVGLYLTDEAADQLHAGTLTPEQLGRHMELRVFQDQ